VSLGRALSDDPCRAIEVRDDADPPRPACWDTNRRIAYSVCSPLSSASMLRCAATLLDVDLQARVARTAQTGARLIGEM